MGFNVPGMRYPPRPFFNQAHHIAVTDAEDRGVNDEESQQTDAHMQIAMGGYRIPGTLKPIDSVFGVGYSYMVRLIKKGPQPHESFATEADGRPARPLSAVTTGNKEQP